jgi:hypothetical protein
MTSDDQLKKVVRDWSTRAPSPQAVALADAARERHGGVAAVLFYGSCLRSGRIDEGIADLYLIVDDYRSAFRSRLLAFLNHLLPPNVFYLETPYAGKTLRAKYAVLSLEDFARGAHRWFHSYIWGRFAQPSGLIYARDSEIAVQIQQTLTHAVHTFIRRTLPQAPETFTIRELWTRGLRLSYRCELRSENSAMAARLFEATSEYYAAVTKEALKASRLELEALPGEKPCRYRLRISSHERQINALGWHLRRIQGKGLSVLRLLKCLLTFENGLGYLLWKIERQAGIRIEPNSALRRLLPLAVSVTLWRLFKKRTFRSAPPDATAAEILVTAADSPKLTSQPAVSQIE